ncbi:hypothetical protein [Methylobrevis pamukkalensis]|uniref:HD domain-containing protein n=1 Tax=Methylobrevis pamukkalensis TaxID=1439726 RepID=A0A1E3H789_9HYPH|nr:hypothetical protein [Methylobrevis pamukkalensis]ODN72198.1 hypothetical protein A6302_00496 [Methylobrevis pamukkalensis]
MPHIFIQTATGRAVDLLDPRADMIDIEGDIAPALARIPRFNGHARGANGHAYSVAQHCCHGAELLREASPKIALAFLLHDAHEAYLGDLTRPAMEAIDLVGGRPSGARTALNRIKSWLDAAIFAAAGIDAQTARGRLVRDMDEAMLEFERRTFLGRSDIAWQANGGIPAPVDFTGAWPADEAEHHWMGLYRNLQLEIDVLTQSYLRRPS